jgi:hypothetical protein
MTCTLLLTALATALWSAASVTPAPGASDPTCRGTLPNHVVPADPGFGRAAFNYGTSRLRAHLNWKDGILRAGTLPDGGSVATIGADGTIRVKQGWWRGQAGRLLITGRRLDRSAPPARANVPTGYGDTGFTPVELLFPTTGCWRVDARQGTAKLSYVVRVVKLAG